MFWTNRDRVEPEEISSVVNGYSRRWDIENQYKSIKEVVPMASSTDYRLRFCNFALSTLIYNLWRLTDYLVKVALDEPIRSPPGLRRRRLFERWVTSCVSSSKAILTPGSIVR